MVTAVITGASSGLGKEYINAIINQYPSVDAFWLVARRKELLKEIAQEHPDKTIAAISLDLGEEESLEIFEKLLKENQPEIKVLVNNAGYGKCTDFFTSNRESQTGMVDLNCRALVDVTHAALHHMGRGGRIIQIASAAGFAPLPHMNVYAATKAFVLRYTRALRWELHGTGITVTALCPTWVKTGFEQVARASGGGHDVGHLMGEQTPETVVRRALGANKAHFAVACASPQSAALRLIGKVMPSCVTMAGWNLLRRL